MCLEKYPSAWSMFASHCHLSCKVVFWGWSLLAKVDTYLCTDQWVSDQKYSKLIFVVWIQGDYEMVISDYGRAKSLFAGTDIKIFKRGERFDNVVIHGNSE